MLVAFGFKVGAAPFHLAIPDAYSGASSIVAGLLATASKAMGFVALLRILVLISMPEQGEAFWMIIIAMISIITMTWGNISALSSSNPKRILAYSSVAHAGYILATISAIGTGLGNLDSYSLIITAVLFHLSVLVVFKLGAFLVLNILELRNQSHKLEGLNGLARKDPILAGSMFIFLLSLAGVPPFSGFLSKLLMINGILNSTIDTGSMSATAIQEWIVSVDLLFWLALAIVLNSALSLFYYLRMGMIMFFEEPENDKPVIYSIWIKISIVILAIMTALFGIGPISETLLDSVTNSANDFLGISR
jgi:NADH-quinone oxidoreductase subunit N